MGKQRSNRWELITPAGLRSLYTELFSDETTSSYDKKALWAATTLAFFTCLQSDEFVSPNAKHPHTNALSGRRQCVKVICWNYSKESKTDRSASGQVACVGITEDTICSVQAMKKYICSRILRVLCSYSNRATSLRKHVCISQSQNWRSHCCSRNWLGWMEN